MDNALVLAKAIYDNDAESKDELSFKRGDVVTVLEQNTGGLEGWWLCLLQGKQGIAPGNRLKILFDPNFKTFKSKTADGTYDVPPLHPWMNSSKPIEDDQEYDIPRQQLKYYDAVDGHDPSQVYDVPKAGVWQQKSGEEVYDTPTVSINRLSDDFAELDNVPNRLNVAPDPKELYDVPPTVSKDFAQSVEVYDVPTNRIELFSNEMIVVQHPEEVYDIPSSIKSDSIKSPVRHESVESDVVYDIPQSNKIIGGAIIPPGLNSLRRMKREVNESRRIQNQLLSSEPNLDHSDYVYDVPPLVSKDKSNSSLSQSNDDVVDGLLQHLSISETSTSDLKNPNISAVSRDSLTSLTEDLLQYKDVKVTVEEALSQLLILKAGLENAVSNLLTLVKENWRKIENISGKVHNIQKSFMDVLVAVNQFLVYARSATANACAAIENDGNKAPMQVRLTIKKLLQPLEEDLKMLTGAIQELESSQWDLKKLAIEKNIEDGTILDAVDSFVMTSRAVSDDAQQMAIFVHSNAQYIFKKSSDTLNISSTAKSPSSESIAHPSQEIQALQARPLPAVPQSIIISEQINKSSSNKETEGWLDDYDYVALPEKENNEDGKNESVRTEKLLTGLNKRKTQLLNLEKTTQSVVDVYKLSAQEKEKLKKLEINTPELLQSLSHAIDKFVTAISKGESPPSFVALGKHVIFCAHKLVFVGDCVHQHLIVDSAKHNIKEQCEAMCSVLKRTVTSTKLAALQWPSVIALQDMIDKMCDITTCAHQIHVTLLNLIPNN